MCQYTACGAMTCWFAQSMDDLLEHLQVDNMCVCVFEGCCGTDQITGALYNVVIWNGIYIYIFWWGVNVDKVILPIEVRQQGRVIGWTRHQNISSPALFSARAPERIKAVWVNRKNSGTCDRLCPAKFVRTFECTCDGSLSSASHTVLF